MTTRPPSFPPPKVPTPLERCMALLEVRRILSDLWIHAETDFDRQEIEETLIPLRRMLQRLCKDHGLPLG